MKILPFIINGKPPRLIYLNGTPGTPVTLADKETPEQNDEAERREQMQARNSAVTRANFSPEVKQAMRRALRSENTEYENVVDSVLNGEMTPEVFQRQLEELESEDSSWENIFSKQREVRSKIQALQARAESYVELIPRKRLEFQSLVKEARILNRSDDRTDRSLRKELFKLIKPNPPARTSPVINEDQAREIYLAAPSGQELQRVLGKYRGAIEAAPDGGGASLRKIISFKREEEKVERQFTKVANDLNAIIIRNLNKARRELQKENMLKAASSSIGITIKEGTEIETDVEILILGGSNRTKIQRVTFESKRVKDSAGKTVDILDTPYIHLSNGSIMSLGRFKKWVDASDAVEVLSNKNALEKTLNLPQYGIKLEKGMSLSYQSAVTDSAGVTKGTAASVSIADIKDGKIYLDRAVPFPSMEGNGRSSEEMLEVMTFGQFAKWWHRKEVEKGTSLAELRELLRLHNDIENKEFGIPAKDNPPIFVTTGEVLHFPDEQGDTLTIDSVGHDSVTVCGKEYKFPEFWHWVKENHVQKLPTREKSHAEIEAEKKRQDEIAADIAAVEAKKMIETRKGAEKIEHLRQDPASAHTTGMVARLGQLWWSTQFLSLKDLFSMGNEIVEFVKRKHDRRSKGRIGAVGARLPSVLGTEFERIRQSAEDEEVHKNKEAMEHWSISKVKNTLHTTNNKDNAKAAIEVLVNKGEMRWDDHEFWATLNRLTSRYTLKGPQLQIPKQEDMPLGKSGEIKAQTACDALWGDGTGAEWFSQSISKYNSIKGSFEAKFKQLENDPLGNGGPAGACRDMLVRWRNGIYVSPHEYEEMIDGALKYGKMTAEEKVFYMFAGVLAHEGGHAHGETLLHIDRLGVLDSEYLNQFPLLDFFTQERVPDYTKWNEKEQKYDTRKLNLKDIEAFAREYNFYDELFPVDHTKTAKPGSNFCRFMWERMLLSESVETRLSKGIRRAGNMDHDDAHFIVPTLGYSEMKNISSSIEGNQKFFSNPGYMNTYPGFNQCVLNVSYAIEEASDKEKREKLVTKLEGILNSFVLLDSILDNRYLKSEGDHRARLDDSHYDRTPVVDGSCTVRTFQQQMRSLVKAIGREYGEDWSWLYGTKTGSWSDKNEQLKQQEHERKIDAMKENLEKAVNSDGGAKALAVIQRFRLNAEKEKNGPMSLRWIKGSERPDGEEMAKNRAAARAFMLADGGEGGHGGGGHH